MLNYHCILRVNGYLTDFCIYQWSWTIVFCFGAGLGSGRGWLLYNYGITSGGLSSSSPPTSHNTVITFLNYVIKTLPRNSLGLVFTFGAQNLWLLFLPGSIWGSHKDRNVCSSPFWCYRSPLKSRACQIFFLHYFGYSVPLLFPKNCSQLLF